MFGRVVGGAGSLLCPLWVLGGLGTWQQPQSSPELLRAS